MSTKNVNINSNNSKKNRTKYQKKKRTNSDAYLRKKSAAKLAKDTKQLKKMSRKSIIRHCKQYNLPFDGNKDKAIRAIYNKKKKQSKKKNKKNYKNNTEKKTKINNKDHKKQKNNYKKNNKKKTKKKKTHNRQPSLSHKQFKVTYVKNRKKEMVDKIFEAKKKKSKKNKKRRKVKRLSLTLNTDQLEEFKQEAMNSQQTTNNSLLQSITTEMYASFLTPLDESNENKSPETQHKNNQRQKPKTNTHKKRKKSIIALIAHAPKLDYPIPDMHGFDTVKDIKDALPVDAKPDQCKLFYGGKELDDNQTIALLQIADGSELNVLLSWKYFKPDPTAAHPKTMEHRHYNKVAELKRLHNLDTFSILVIGIQRKCNNGDVIIELAENTQRILQQYCICLSGDRTYDRKWTKLHSLCYDYQNDIGMEMMVDLLKKHNLDTDKKESLYIDAWPHSGYDTPLKMAIKRANPKEAPKDIEEAKMNEINAKAAVELVEFLVLNGARRRIGLILTNLERTGDDDHTYPFMAEQIRDKLIAILKPYEGEDPWKPAT